MLKKRCFLIALLNICGSKVSKELRLEIPYSLFKLVPIYFFIKGGVKWDLFSLAGINKYPDFVKVTKTWLDRYTINKSRIRGKQEM